MIEHLPECWAKQQSDPPASCICDELRACETRVTAAFHQGRADDRGKWQLLATMSYHQGCDDTRWITAKEALESVLHENCDCAPCQSTTRALAELRTIGNE